MSQTPQTPQKPTPPQIPLLGKPLQKRFPTPNIKDYLASVRRDTRAAGFKMPAKGDVFDGVDQQDRIPSTFKFATAIPVEQFPGSVDLYYVAPFSEQEKYAFTVEFPYVDTNWPRYTYTYFATRTDDIVTQEAQADAPDPAGLGLMLTDHKIERIGDDPILDAVFVKVNRIFEKLPGPIIVSFENNQAQQLVTVQTQEVVKGAPPIQSALTEKISQERTGSAKAKNTLASVPVLFPATGLTTEIPSMTRELWLGGFNEQIFTQVQAGQAVQPVITSGNYSISDKNLTIFKHEVTIHSLPPQVRNHKEYSEVHGGGVIAETISIIPAGTLPVPTPDEGYLITESKVRNLAAFGFIKLTKILDISEGVTWPILRELETDPKLGILVQMRKQVVPAGLVDPPLFFRNQWGNPISVGLDEFVDIKAVDKWKSIQIASKVIDPLPPDVSWDVVEHLDLPHYISALGPKFNDEQLSEASTTFHGPATGSDGSGTSRLTTLTEDINNPGNYNVHTKNNNYTDSVISRTFSIANAKNRIAVGADFEIATTRGFLGFCPAVVTRHITRGPPPLGWLYLPGAIGAGAILKMTPVTGIATLIERATLVSEVDGTANNTLTNSSEIKTKTISFGPFLDGGFSTTDKTPGSEQIILDAQNTRQNTRQYIAENGTVVLVFRHYYPNYDVYHNNVVWNTGGPIVGASATGLKTLLSVPGAPGATRTSQTNPLNFNTAGVVSELRIILPPSSPTNLGSGNKIVVKVEGEAWRLNLFVTYVTTVTLP